MVSADNTVVDPVDLPLRQCQKDCLEACAKGARKIEMACGTGKTRVMKELVSNMSGRVSWFLFCIFVFTSIISFSDLFVSPDVTKYILWGGEAWQQQVLITVPLRALLDQFAPDFPAFCKVGTGHNDKIDYEAKGFISVAKWVDLLQNVSFDAILVDEAHHPLPPGLPKCENMFQFSATLGDNTEFNYSMGQAIEDGILCDYDITVPAITAHHAYVCLADLLLKQAGRFRRVLAYCNSIAEAKKFQMVLQELGLAAWHINAFTSQKKREQAMDKFTGVLQKPAHVLVTVEVLGEGINIPNADTCMFVQPKNSYRSIVQAIGRVLRHHPSKTVAHIVLPAVAIPNQNQDFPSSVNAFRPDHQGTPRDLEEHAFEDGATKLDHEAGSLQPRSINATKNSVVRVLKSNPTTGTSEETAGAIGAMSSANGKTSAQAVLPAILNESVEGGGNTYSNTLGFSQGSSAQVHCRPFHPVEEQSETHVSFMMIGSESEDSASVRSKQDTIKNAEVHFQQLAQADSLRVEQARGQLDPQLAHRKSAAAGGKEAQSLKGRSWNQNRSHLVRVAAGRRGVRRSLMFRSPNTLFNRSYDSQLERFLEMLVQADHRLFGKNGRHRIQIVDCREGDVEGELELGKEIWVEEIYARLSAIWFRKDPWNLRLQDVEEYVRDTGILPRQGGIDATARSLGVWLREQGFKFRTGGLQPQQIQNLLASPSSLIRERACLVVMEACFLKDARNLVVSFLHKTGFQSRVATKHAQKNTNLPHGYAACGVSNAFIPAIIGTCWEGCTRWFANCWINGRSHLAKSTPGNGNVNLGSCKLLYCNTKGFRLQ